MGGSSRAGQGRRRRNGQVAQIEGRGSVAGCRGRSLRSSSSRMRIGWRTAETVSLSSVDGAVRAWRTWKARRGRGQVVVVAGWSGRWIEYLPYPVWDPGSWARQASARGFCPSTKVQGCKKEKTVPSWTLPRQESRPAPSRKEDGQSGLVWELEPTNSGVPIKWQFSQYPYRWVVARRSSIPLRLPVPVSQSPAPQLPSTLFSLRRRQGAGGPMGSPRGSVSPSRASRGGQLSSRTWNLRAWLPSSEWHRQVYDREQSRRMQRWMALRSKLLWRRRRPHPIQRQTLAEPPAAIFRTAAGTAYPRERGEGMYCFSRPSPEVTSWTPKVWLQYRGHGIRTWRLEPVCASQVAWAPPEVEGRLPRPPPDRWNPAVPATCPPCSHVSVVWRHWSPVWASQITGTGCWGTLWGRDMPPSLALAFTRPRRPVDRESGRRRTKAARQSSARLQKGAQVPPELTLSIVQDHTVFPPITT
jgi:hypothetical protein